MSLGTDSCLPWRGSGPSQLPEYLPSWDVISFSPSHYRTVSVDGAGGLKDMLPQNLEQSYPQRQNGAPSAKLSHILMARSKERLRRSDGEGLAYDRGVEKDGEDQTNDRGVQKGDVPRSIPAAPGNAGRGIPGLWTGSTFTHRTHSSHSSSSHCPEHEFPWHLSQFITLFLAACLAGHVLLPQGGSQLCSGPRCVPGTHHALDKCVLAECRTCHPY